MEGRAELHLTNGRELPWRLPVCLTATLLIIQIKGSSPSGASWKTEVQGEAGVRAGLSLAAPPGIPTASSSSSTESQGPYYSYLLKVPALKPPTGLP